MLHIKNLSVSIENKKIIENLNLKIAPGEIHVIMGTNGSGKSTLVNALMGNPLYQIANGKVTLNDTDITNLCPSKRANLGLFLSFQNPVEVPGVSLRNFLRQAKIANTKAENIHPLDFVEQAQEEAKKLKFSEEFLLRPLNEGFSGGEKKKAEILQMAILKPKFALIDEIDSGLDIDALKDVAKAITKIHKEQNPGILLITHYNRILKYIEPDHVHIFSDGKIIKSGDKKLAHELEENGYENYIKNA